MQAAQLGRGEAGVALVDRLLVFPAEGKLFWVDARYGPAAGAGEVFADTLLSWKKTAKYPEAGPDDPRDFLHAVGKQGAITPLPGRGYLHAKLADRDAPEGLPKLRAEAAHRGHAARAVLRCRELLEREAGASRYGWTRPLVACGARGDALFPLPAADPAWTEARGA